MSDIFKSTRKDQVFEKLVKKMKPITMDSLRRSFRVVRTKTGNYRHVLEFDFEGFDVNVELKEKK